MSDIMRIPASPATLKDLLQQAKPSIQNVLPRHLSADRLIKIALLAINKTPKLQECTAGSVLASIMAAAELGLDCGGSLGSAYLVPYGDQCTLIIGYRGLIDLARRSGEVESIEARAVYNDDKFQYEEGLNPVLNHIPNLDRVPDPANLKGVYFIAKMFESPRAIIDWMSKAEIDAIRHQAKAKFGPWVDHYIEMAKKTIIRRGCKQLPLSPEKAQKFAAAETMEDTDFSAIIDPPTQLPAPPVPDRAESIADRIDVLRQQAKDDGPSCEITGPPEEPTVVDDPGEALFDPEKQADPIPEGVEDRHAALVDGVATQYSITMDIADDVVKEWRVEHDITGEKLKDGRSWPSIQRSLQREDLTSMVQDRIPF